MIVAGVNIYFFKFIPTYRKDILAQYIIITEGVIELCRCAPFRRHDTNVIHFASHY